MKTQKESLGFKIFWFLIIFSPKYFIIALLFTPLNLDTYTHFLIAILLALFWSKNETDKTELENKIFELKELINKTK